MAELVVVDRALVQALNHAAQPQPLRLLILLAATALAAGPLAPHQDRKSVG